LSPRDLRIRQLLGYDPETGVLRRLTSSRWAPAGPTGSVGQNGYAYVSFDGKKELVHRVAWFLMTGEWPRGDIDHINGDPLDMRWRNLRDVDRRTNNENRHRVRCDNLSSGMAGVSRMRSRWRARLVVDGATHYLGVFDTPDEASAVYLHAKRQLHAGCTL
jgi:hypothetical protein